MTRFMALFARSQLAFIGLIILSLILILAILTPWLPLNDPNVIDTSNRFKRPFSEDSILGTDHLGRDLLSRLLWGTRLSIAVGLCAAIIAAFIGSAIGVIAGFYGGHTDNIIMRGVDMLMAFPYILLALAIVAALGPGLMNALIAVAIVNIPFFARNIRGVTLGIVHREFVDAARLSGMSNAKIIINEILPNVFPVIVVAMSTTVGWMILETAGLSFLGLGSQPPQADLGSMLGEARAAIITSPHTSVVPGVMILIIVMAINLVGDGIRDVLDPRLKSGALSTPHSTTEVEKNKSDAGLKTQSLLSINGLKTEFRIGNRVLKAVNDVSLTVDKGQCVGIIGESGSGKSVTALSIMRLVSSPPGIITDGSIDFKGDDLLKLSSEDLRDFRGKKVSYVFQDPLSTLHPLYTVGQQLSEAIQSHNHVGKLEKHKKALELLQAVRISNPEKRLNSYPHELSGGMRQRIGIAMALANDPDIIIADEPTTALDVTVQAQILKLFQDLRREKGLALVFITHDFGVISQICDKVAVMYAGKIVETGPAAEILKSPAHPYTARLKSCVPELGQGKRNLIAIPGFPPMIDNMPSGCAFASRCEKVEQKCHSAMVDAKKIGQERAVRCLFPEEIKAG
tara:strand:+ start:4670 stop:6547 length:1878 start_codon:yes stop_codon:yes gene_type:complete